MPQAARLHCLQFIILEPALMIIAQLELEPG